MTAFADMVPHQPSSYMVPHQLRGVYLTIIHRIYRIIKVFQIFFLKNENQTSKTFFVKKNDKYCRDKGKKKRKEKKTLPCALALLAI